jgi:hypothetical protein
MGDNFKKVQTGQPLKIPAATFNSFIDAAEDFRARQQSREQESKQSFKQTGIVRVKNESGEDRQRFDILGVDRPIFTPTDNLDSFRNEVALVGVLPDKDEHAGRFVVLLEPLRENQIGLAVVSGVCAVHVDVNEEADTFAEVNDGDASQLRSAGSGSATILWKEPGTGAGKWAVVRLGAVKPIIRKAEMIDMLEQGDTDPAKAWLLKFENDEWVRTDKQIDLYGDQGFRGVAFGRTEAVDAGDKIDVYYSLEAEQWYGVVGGWYFHGNVVDDIAKGQEGQVTLNVGAGQDQREITVNAFSPYTEVKADDFVAVNWNTFSVHWDIEKIQSVKPGCGLKEDDGEIKVNNEVLAGDGLVPSGECGLAVGAGCGIFVDADAVHFNAPAAAGAGLFAVGCSLNVLPSCGIAVDGSGVRFNPADVAGEGLTVGSGCKLRPNLGCGLKFNGSQIQFDANTVAGPGLEAFDGCVLGVKVDCGLAVVAEGIIFSPTEVAGPGLTTYGDCGLQLNVGCGLELDGDAVAVNPFDLAGTGLLVEGACRLQVDTIPDGAYTFSALTDVSLSISGCTLTLSKTTTEFELKTNEAGIVVGFEEGASTTSNQSVDLCACDPRYDCDY